VFGVKEKIKVKKACYSLLAIMMFLIIFGIFIPDHRTIASTPNTTVMNSAPTVGDTPFYPINSNDDNVGNEINAALSQGTGSHWALWNLILGIASVLLVVVITARDIARSKHDDDKERKEKGSKKRIRLMMFLATPILAILAIYLFILTQDMTKPMVLTDVWTLVHAILFGAGLLSCIFLVKKNKDEKNLHQLVHS